MEWLKQSNKQQPFNLHADGKVFGAEGLSPTRFRGMAALTAACLLWPALACALEPARAAHFPAHSAALSYDSLRRMSDDELRRVAAQGFSDPLVQTDRLFNDAGKHMAGGNAIDILGNLATLLNVPLDMLARLAGAEISFRNIIYSPANPATIAGWDGTTFTRLPSTIEELRIRRAHMGSTSGGASFGDVEVRNIEMGGTRIVVKYRQ